MLVHNLTAAALLFGHIKAKHGPLVQSHSNRVLRTKRRGLYEFDAEQTQVRAIQHRITAAGFSFLIGVLEPYVPFQGGATAF